MRRRAQCILYLMNNKECLLFYIDRIIDTDNELKIKINSIVQLIKNMYKYKHKILYVIPISNPTIFKKELFEDDIIKIIGLMVPSLDQLELDSKKVNISKQTSLLDSDVKDSRIDWNNIISVLKDI